MSDASVLPASRGRSAPAAAPRRLCAATLGLAAVGLCWLGQPAAATTVATPGAVTVFGAAGSFGTLGHTLPTRQPVTKIGVSGWSFLPGQAAYTTALGPDGTLLIGNEPQTDVQTSPTAPTMVVSAFTPGTRSFRNLVIPTSTGALSATAPGARSGGADIGGIATGADGSVAFVSSVPYHGWDQATRGQYPSVGFLKGGQGAASYRYASGLTGDALQQVSNPVLACPFKVVSHDCNGLSDLVGLAGGRFAVAAYMGDQAADSGSVVVLSAQGRALQRLQLPAMRLAGGALAAVRPRLATASTTGSEVAIVADVTSGTRTYPHVLIRFQVRDGVLHQSSPFLLPQDPAGRKLGYEAARFDGRGNLWVSEAVSNTLEGGRTGVFLAGTTASTAGCPALSGPSASPEDAVRCSPSISSAVTSSQGLVRMMTADPLTGDMYLATMSGYLQRLTLSVGATTLLTAAPTVDLGLGSLVDRSRFWVAPRQGVIDPVTRTLYFPVQQLLSPAVCASSCPPTVLPQWVYGVALTRPSTP